MKTKYNDYLMNERNKIREQLKLNILKQKKKKYFEI